MAGSAPGAEFVAGNASQVLVDIWHGTDSDLTASRQVATEKCALFGKTSAVLQSINPISGGKDRVSFACQ
jgi:hypothetical protein